MTHVIHSDDDEFTFHITCDRKMIATKTFAPLNGSISTVVIEAWIEEVMKEHEPDCGKRADRGPTITHNIFENKEPNA